MVAQVEVAQVDTMATAEMEIMVVPMHTDLMEPVVLAEEEEDLVQMVEAAALEAVLAYMVKATTVSAAHQIPVVAVDPVVLQVTTQVEIPVETLAAAAVAAQTTQVSRVQPTAARVLFA
jgi:3D (Asp-Asp-Asp) domain-containing protein